MADEYEEHIRRFFRSNADLKSLLNKIEDRKITGDYYANKAIKEGMAGYILRIKLFVPAAPKADRKRRSLVKLEEVWVVDGTARLLLTTPPDYVPLSSLRYEGNWLKVTTARGRQLNFFLGIPLLWSRRTTTYSNGVLQILAPLRLPRKSGRLKEASVLRGI